MVPLAVVTAIVMLVGWFPLSAIWHQQSELNSTSAQINAIKSQQRALHAPGEVNRLQIGRDPARARAVSAVSTGQSLIQVLPGIGPNDAIKHRRPRAAAPRLTLVGFVPGDAGPFDDVEAPFLGEGISFAPGAHP